MYPRTSDPELVKRVRPSFYPYQANELVITSPGNQGGPNYGPSSFSPITGLYYVTGKNDAYSIRVALVGDTIQPGPGPTSPGHYKLLAEVGKTGVTSSQNLVAYEPVSGNQAWSVELPRVTSTGNFVTAGNVLVQAVSRALYAFDARTGAQLFKITLRGATRASPMTYQAGGTQYIAMMTGNTLVALGLP
jgi:outer membrane protein assembly factor BamB